MESKHLLEKMKGKKVMQLVREQQDESPFCRPPGLKCKEDKQNTPLKELSGNLSWSTTAGVTGASCVSGGILVFPDHFIHSPWKPYPDLKPNHYFPWLRAQLLTHSQIPNAALTLARSILVSDHHMQGLKPVVVEIWKEQGLFPQAVWHMLR